MSDFSTPDSEADSQAPISPTSEIGAMAVFLLKAENDSRQDQVEMLCERTHNFFLNRLDPLLPERLVLEQRLENIRRLTHQQTPSTQVADLKSEHVRRQNLNHIMEGFGQLINRYDPAFINYVENFSLYNPQTRLGFTDNAVIDYIFATEKQARHCDHSSISGETPICAACELLRFKTVLARPNPELREAQRQAMEDVWVAKLSGNSPQKARLPAY